MTELDDEANKLAAQYYMEEDLLVIRPEGVMTPERFRRIASEVAALRHPNMLWDLTAAEPGELGDLFELSTAMGDIIGKHSSGRTAFLAASDLGYGLARAAAAWSDRDWRRVRAFRNRQEAFEWLRNRNCVDDAD